MTTLERGEEGSVWRKLLRFLHLPSNIHSQERQKYTYFSLFRPLKDVQSRIVLVLGVLLAIAAGIPLPIIGVIFAKIIDVFPPTEDEVRSRIFQLLAVALAYFVVTWGWTFCWGIIGARVSRGLRIELIDRALGLDQTYYETVCPDITSRLTSDAQTVQAGTAEKVGIFIQSVSYFITAFIVGFILNAHLTGILFAAVIPSMTIVVIIGTSFLGRFSKQAAEETTSAITIAEGAIKAVQVVQAFDAFDSLTTEHEKHLISATKIGRKKAITGAILLGSVFFIAYATNALAFWQGSRILRSDSNSGSAGTIYAIVFLILDASFVIGQAGPFIQSFSAAASAGRRIFHLIDYSNPDIDVYSLQGVQADENTFGPNKEIIFKDVSFTYPARPLEQVLDSVNIKIRTGTSVGIVGASGSGKSTIAALLARLYDPSSGSVTIDGCPIPKYCLSSLRGQIALVDQDPAVFSGTVYSNIKDGFKTQQFSESEMRRKCMLAAKAADAWTFIEALPNGLDTSLGDPDGTKLSGGQKQRLCLARALVGDPAILVLDEATSALDTISEAAILESLGKARALGNRTTIMIAHRLASVKSADEIIVMGKGQVLEQGSHKVLMEKPDGAYRSLIEAQTFLPEESSDDDISEVRIVTPLATHASEKREDNNSGGLSSSMGENKPLGNFTILKRCIELSWPKVLLLSIALLGSLATGALIIGESIIFGHLVALLNGPVASNKVNFYCLMFFVVAVVALGGYIASGTCFGVVSEHLIQRTRDISLRTILRQDMEWFLQPSRSTSSLVSVINMDSGHLSGLSGVIIGTIVSAMVAVIGGAILAHVVAWKIAIVLFATSPVIILSGYYRLRVLAKLEENNQLAYTEAAFLAAEACSSIRTIAVLGTERATSKKFRLAIDKYRLQTFRQTALGNLILAFALAITYFVYALAYWWGARNVRSGEYSSLQFFIVLPAILFSAQTAGQIFSLAPDISRAKGAASRVFALHDQKPSIDAVPLEDDVSCRKEIPLRSPSAPTGSITFQNVSLTYHSRPNNPVFIDLNLHIKAGETVALVGRSGAGKTSTISLIERFYDPTSGSILIDGVDVRSVPVSQHRARISLVSQDPDLFSGSVAFNVGLGAQPGHIATRDEIVEACKAVGIHEFVSGLPDGYETQCGNNGSQLSGGQKQRVAIARAYIRDPEILLLDEATSALDSHSETQIQSAITAATKKRTTIMIAHRLTSVQKADRILVFDRGRIVEEGRHDELIRGGGIYEQMIKAQNLG